MKKKNIISLSIALTFLTLSITGLLLYLVKHNDTTTIIHVVFGLLFISFAIFHIINNWSSLAGYTTGGESKIKREFLWSFAFVGAFLVGSFFHLPPFEQIEEFGSMVRKLGNGNGKGRTPRITFEEIETNQDTNGVAIKLILQKGKEARLPALTIWAEDSTHTFIENLFVPSKIASMHEDDDDSHDDKPEFKDFTPNSFPLWKAKATLQTPNYPKETPNGNFFLNTKTKGVGTFNIVLEVKDGDATELYEAKINTAQGEVFKLKPKEKSTILSGIIEINQ